MEGRPSSGHSTNKCREPKHGRRAEFKVSMVGVTGLTEPGHTEPCKGCDRKGRAWSGCPGSIEWGHRSLKV